MDENSGFGERPEPDFDYGSYTRRFGGVDFMRQLQVARNRRSRHPIMRTILCIFLFALLLPMLCTVECAASAYDARPKLVILLVFDQFPDNYLVRYRADFKDNGFNLFLEHGAFFPNCYFDYGNLATAAGNATIATGTYSDGHGIASDAWWDLKRNTKRPITAVEDPRYMIVGLPSGSTASMEGASPRNLMASTIGDEVRLATGGQSKVYSISAKDSAAILLGGHAANGAFWIDPKSGVFITSTYYMPSLPGWAQAFNQSNFVTPADTVSSQTGNTISARVTDATDTGVQHELDFAEELIAGEKLGTDATTDVLTISIASSNNPGQRIDPDSADRRQRIDQLDGNLNDFFQWLDHNIPGGLPNVWIAMTADHGLAPIPSYARQLGLPAATIDVKALVAAIDKTMNDRFSPDQHLEYMLPHQELPYIALNIPVFERAGINELEGEQAVQNAIPAAVASLDPEARLLDSKVKPAKVRAVPVPRIFRTFTRLQMAALQPGLPPTEFGRLIAHSYSPNGGWYVMLVPEAYQMQTVSGGTTHFSAYSYDRHVPLAFYGDPFNPGIYREHVQPVDLATTLAAMLAVNPPSASIGRALLEAIRQEPTIKNRRRRGKIANGHPIPKTRMRHADGARSITSHPDAARAGGTAPAASRRQTRPNATPAETPKTGPPRK